jgi:hypothetical protein
MNLTSHSVNREIWVKPRGTDKEFAHFITCDIYIKKQSVIAHAIPNTRLSHPCLQSVYENAGNAHADICFYNNMFTVTQVTKKNTLG